jgi:transposase-like protein
MAKRTLTPEEKIGQAIYDIYKPQSAEEIQDALKKIFAPLFEAALKGEMENHLGYPKNGSSPEKGSNSRNGYSLKTVKTTMSDVPIQIPRDRESTFEPQIIKKHQRDVSSIEGKVLAMYGRGMSQRDIASTIEDIYGFSISHEQISHITDYIMEEVYEWQNRPLLPFYPFLFVDCIYVSMRTERAINQKAVYVILGYDINGNKDILGLWINETEGKHTWMQIFDEIKSRGVQDVGFISMDGVSGLEEGARAIFPGTVVQRCIVHLIRNSLRYVPWNQSREFMRELKAIYRAVNVEEARRLFAAFKKKWSQFPGAISVWERNFSHVEQLFNYGPDVRKVMYTTNAIESINSSFRKVTKKGSFQNNEAVMKIFYLRILELKNKKWKGKGRVSNWPAVRNQLLIDDRIGQLIEKYDGLN